MAIATDRRTIQNHIMEVAAGIAGITNVYDEWKLIHSTEDIVTFLVDDSGDWVTDLRVRREAVGTQRYDTHTVLLTHDFVLTYRLGHRDGQNTENVFQERVDAILQAFVADASLGVYSTIAPVALVSVDDVTEQSILFLKAVFKVSAVTTELGLTFA